jgi:hypothetical protein
MLMLPMQPSTVSGPSKPLLSGVPFGQRSSGSGAGSAPKAAAAPNISAAIQAPVLIDHRLRSGFSIGAEDSHAAGREKPKKHINQGLSLPLSPPAESIPAVDGKYVRKYTET